MQEHRRGRERDLRELEHDADLENEVDAFGTVFALGFGGEAFEDGGCAEELVFCEKPLGFGQEEDFAGEDGGLEDCGADGLGFFGCGCGRHGGRAGILGLGWGIEDLRGVLWDCKV